MYDRAILHIDFDAFFASVECLQNSSMKGKPLIIGGTSERGVVVSCNLEASTFGIHAAMPIKMAKHLCPEVLVVKGNMDLYAKYSGMITEMLAAEAPVFEKAGIDEFYLDLSGIDKYIGCLKWSIALQQKIKKTFDLPVSFGLSINKLIAKMGTGEAKPNGLIEIPSGEEQGFINPLAVDKLPNVGQQTSKRLSLMGVETIKVLSEIPMSLLEREFGQKGITLWKKANAIDNRPVVAYNERKSISTEHTFEENTIDFVSLKAALIDMVSRLAFSLRQAEKVTACLTLKIRYADFNTQTKQLRIPYTANDKNLTEQALSLFIQLYQRRQLIRLVGIKFSHLISGNYQINLFDDSLHETDQLKVQFEPQVIQKASALYPYRFDLYKVAKE
ncbi:MAG: DNA polymerase IV [Saprospiraceae bacterium]